MHRLESDWDLSEETCAFFFLDLISHRNISNDIATKSAVHHQSPQLIVLKDRSVIYQASHGAISVDALKAALD
jgi:bacillithiol system protein YtxJ